jgi:hypothetical protein
MAPPLAATHQLGPARRERPPLHGQVQVSVTGGGHRPVGEHLGDDLARHPSTDQFGGPCMTQQVRGEHDPGRLAQPCDELRDRLVAQRPTHRLGPQVHEDVVGIQDSNRARRTRCACRRCTDAPTAPRPATSRSCGSWPEHRCRCRREGRSSPHDGGRRNRRDTTRALGRSSSRSRPTARTGTD